MTLIYNNMNYQGDRKVNCNLSVQNRRVIHVSSRNFSFFIAKYSSALVNAIIAPLSIEYR
jgi:hypothetical protein